MAYSELGVIQSRRELKHYKYNFYAEFLKGNLGLLILNSVINL